MIKFVKKLPKKKLKLGVVKSGGRTFHVYNVGGQPEFYVFNKREGKYIKSKQHTNSGLFLRKLGIEVNAGGGIFVPRGYSRGEKRKTFRGMTQTQIRRMQRKY